MWNTEDTLKLLPPAKFKDPPLLDASSHQRHSASVGLVWEIPQASAVFYQLSLAFWEYKELSTKEVCSG
jgi:hypothetical protein